MGITLPFPVRFSPDAGEPGALTDEEIEEAKRQAMLVKKWQVGDKSVERPSLTELSELQRDVRLDQARKERGGGAYVPIEFGSTQDFS